VHAEQNAIIQAAKLGISISGATLYCTHQPCVICAKMIINAGISRVVYEQGYPDEFSLQLFGEANIKVEKYTED
jgi:dCMP deaminase